MTLAASWYQRPTCAEFTHLQLVPLAIGFTCPCCQEKTFSRERERRVLVVNVNCRGKVAPSLSVRSGGLPSLIRTFASLRCAPRGKNPYATDRFRPAAEPTGKIRGHPRNNRPILRWDQRSFRGCMLDRVKLCTLETFGDSVATASFLRCKFRSFSPRFPSVIRSPPPVFFGANFVRFRRPSDRSRIEKQPP